LNPYLDRAAFYLTCGSLVSILFSIAVSQIVLGFALATILSWLFSGHVSEETVKVAA